MTPVEFRNELERRTNTHRFEEVAPLLADNAVYWFNNGSFQGKEAIRQALMLRLRPRYVHATSPRKSFVLSCEKCASRIFRTQSRRVYYAPPR